MTAIEFTFGFHLLTARGETSGPALRGHFTTVDDAVILAEATVTEVAMVSLLRCPKLVRDEDLKAFVILHVARCRAAKLILLTLEPLASS